jgi:AraC-like DNA-binding protein
MPRRAAELTVEDWSSLHARLLWCYEGTVEETHRLGTTRGRHLTAWSIRAGRVRVTARGRTLEAQAGEWIFCGPEPREQDFTAGARLLSINFSLEWPSGDSLVAPFFVLPARDHPALTTAARPLLGLLRREFPGVRHDLQGHTASPTSFFRLQQMFSAWVLAYLEAVQAAGERPSRMQGVDPRVMTALRLLDRHRWADSLTEKDLADKVGLSAGHLDRLFVSQMGATPRGYLQKRRLESARAMLREPHLSIKEIGYELGFSSPAHFCHWFRLATGHSPRQFRAEGGVIKSG